MQPPARFGRTPDSRAKAIRAAAAGPLDWDRFLRVVTRQGVVGLVHDGLTRVRPPLPSSIASEIATRAAAMVKQNLALAAEAVELQNLFTQAGIPVVFIKGASLSLLAFGDLGLSASQDIDLLVPWETLPAAIALLVGRRLPALDPPLISATRSCGSCCNFERISASSTRLLDCPSSYTGGCS